MKYVIFGPGRVGRNIDHYLRTLGHEVRIISRREAQAEKARCERLIASSQCVIAALPDDGLSAWRAEWAHAIEARPAVHFSGAALVDGMLGYHPLYSFPNEILDLSVLQSIAFACPPDAPALAQLFPGMTNATFTVLDEDRAYYHALAVLSGNLAAFTWNETAKIFAERFAPSGAQTSTSVLKAYFESIVARFSETPENSMTGPVARRDTTSIAANIAALDRAHQKDPRQANLPALYRAFVDAAWPDRPLDQKRD